MVWSSSMKNDSIGILLPYALVVSESSFELNSKLITEFEWNDRGVQGVINDLVWRGAMAGTDVWLVIAGFIVAVMTP